MSAPPLVLLSPGSPGSRTADAARDLHAQIMMQRPDLVVELAFLGVDRPDVVTVLDRLARVGSTEVVLVPLLTCDRRTATAVTDATEQVERHHHRLRIRTAGPLGSHPLLLDALDLRLRAALSQARVRELDGLILATAGSRDPLEAQWLGRVARAWGARHRLPVSVGHVTNAAPTVPEAIRSLRDRGRRHLGLGSYFLAPDALADEAKSVGLSAGLVVAEPLGGLPEIAQAVLARYAVAGIELLTMPARSLRPVGLRAKAG